MGTAVGSDVIQSFHFHPADPCDSPETKEVINIQGELVLYIELASQRSQLVFIWSDLSAQQGGNGSFPSFPYSPPCSASTLPFLWTPFKGEISSKWLNVVFIWKNLLFQECRSDRDCRGFRRTSYDCRGKLPTILFIFPTCARFAKTKFHFHNSLSSIKFYQSSYVWDTDDHCFHAQTVHCAGEVWRGARHSLRDRKWVFSGFSAQKLQLKEMILPTLKNLSQEYFSVSWIFWIEHNFLSDFLGGRNRCNDGSRCADCLASQDCSAGQVKISRWTWWTWWTC